MMVKKGQGGGGFPNKKLGGGIRYFSKRPIHIGRYCMYCTYVIVRVGPLGLVSYSKIKQMALHSILFEFFYAEQKRAVQIS